MSSEERQKQALIAIRKLQGELEELRHRERQPIAVVGMSCRFPGGRNPEEFWKLLSEGRDGITEIPPDRWDIDAYYDPDPDAPGKMYAGRKEGGKTIYMHREIMQPPEGMMVDHIDGNSLDNRRANMRNCTNQQNMQNIAKSPRASGSFKGVYYDKRRRTLYARICHNGENIYLGTFTTEIEAARAYDRAAVERFGEFARPNFPEEWPEERRKQVQARYRAPVGRPRTRAPAGKRKRKRRR